MVKIFFDKILAFGLAISKNSPICYFSKFANELTVYFKEKVVFSQTYYHGVLAATFLLVCDGPSPLINREQTLISVLKIDTDSNS